MSAPTWLIGLIVVGSLGIAAGCSPGSDAEGSDAAQTRTAGRQATDWAVADGPAAGEDSQHPRVLLITSLGEVIVELNRELAPLTVDNFLEYVDSGHYDGTIFHQVVAGYIVLGGGYTPQLIQKPTRTPIRNEAHNGLSNRRGTLAMARHPDAIDSSTSQFYFNLSDNRPLDHKDRSLEGYGYCVFGTVISGIEVLDRLAQVPVHDTDEFELIPVDPVEIQSVRRISHAAPPRGAIAERSAERGRPATR